MRFTWKPWVLAIAVAPLLGFGLAAQAANISVRATGTVGTVPPDTIETIVTGAGPFWNMENRGSDGNPFTGDDHIDVLLNLGIAVEMDLFTYKNRPDTGTLQLPHVTSLFVGSSDVGGANPASYDINLGQHEWDGNSSAGYTHVPWDLGSYDAKQHYLLRIHRTFAGDSGISVNSHVADFFYEPVPEPASLGLLAVGAIGLLTGRRLGRRSV